MRPQTDLLILLTAVIIITDSQTLQMQLESLINGYGRSNSQKDKRELY
jgi:hypothetical protein